MIIRTEKTGNFSIVSNSPFTSNQLSWKAKGILIYLLTKPNDWNLIINDLVNHSKDGKTSTLSGIDELIQAGYIVKQEQKIIDGKFSKVVYTVSENPLTENQPLLNTNIINTNIINTNRENTEYYNIADFGSNSNITDSCESVESEKDNQLHLKNNNKKLDTVETPFIQENFNQVESVKTAGAVYITRKGKKLTGKRLDSFNEFWEAFNFKHGKADAADEWLKIPVLTDSSVKSIIDTAKREAENRPLIISQGRQPKWAAGWIAGRRWEDEPLQVATTLPTVISGGFNGGVAGAFNNQYSSTPMYGQPTPYGFASTGSKRLDNNLAAGMAFVNSYMNKPDYPENEVRP
ncbi:MAG: hypothetical protein HQK63_13000 [Desulfamplus sp.]|nr:hypothetical protein [Desulfamplus sp.]